MPIDNAKDALDPENIVNSESSLDLGKFNDLSQRLLWGAAIGLIAIACILAGELFFYGLILATLILAAQEWQQMFANLNHKIRFIGVTYLTIPALALIYIRYYSDGTEADSPYMLILCLALVWGSDIGAYFAGKLFGKRPLASKYSPSKTVEGAVGGMAAAAVTSVIASLILEFPSGVFSALFVGCIVSAAAQIGDLVESHMKRQAGIKDSSALIPGHGGVLDRIDALLFAAPVFAVMLWIM